MLGRSSDTAVEEIEKLKVLVTELQQKAETSYWNGQPPPPVVAFTEQMRTKNEKLVQDTVDNCYIKMAKHLTQVTETLATFDLLNRNQHALARKYDKNTFLFELQKEITDVHTVQLAFLVVSKQSDCVHTTDDILKLVQ